MGTCGLEGTRPGFWLFQCLVCPWTPLPSRSAPSPQGAGVWGAACAGVWLYGVPSLSLSLVSTHTLDGEDGDHPSICDVPLRWDCPWT